jgi:UDP-N-acetylglucosamine 2-epimerase
MKLVNLVGARPQFIKMGPISRAIETYNVAHADRTIHEVLVHTGQHYDYEMSGVFFAELGLKAPDYHLNVGSGTHAYQTGEILKRLEEVLLSERPDSLLVYGDTNSTVAGALAAAKLHIPIAHVEAGVRSFNKAMPEEINRLVTDHVSTFLFCPTATAVNNLEREGITGGVHLVGDVMYDSVLKNVQIAEKRSHILDSLTLQPQTYALATVHRAENTDDPVRFRAIFQALDEIARSGLPVVAPLHPRSQQRLASLSLSLTSLRIIKPLSYWDMLWLTRQAKVVLTDSGGVQKEAFFLRVPCVTLRVETEWVETVETGWNVVAGSEHAAIVQKTQAMLQSVVMKRAGQTESQGFGDGCASERILRILTES